MSLDAIAIAVLAASLIGIGVIIVRKFPILAVVDPSASAGAIAQRKRSLIEQRLRRKFSTTAARFGQVLSPITRSTGKLLDRAHTKLVDLEHEYKVRSLPVFLSRRQRRKVDQDITSILAQAQALMDDKEYVAAEEKILQAIRLEPRSVPAFELIGQLYLTTKEYDHAKEIYHYLLKLTGDTDAIYQHLGEADLGAGQLTAAKEEFERAVELNRNVTTYHLELAHVYLALEDAAQAFASIQEAARLEPNNPKVLDQYVEVSIATGKKQFAEDAVARIEAVNPENTKIVTWREQIAAMDDRPLSNTLDSEDDLGDSLR